MAVKFVSGEIWLILKSSGEYAIAADVDTLDGAADDAGFSDEDILRRIRLDFKFKIPNDDDVSFAAYSFSEPGLD